MDNKVWKREEDYMLFKLGTFEQESNRMFVSDPSYQYIEAEHSEKYRLMKLNVVIDNVCTGKWNSLISIKNIDHNRNAELICMHESIDLAKLADNSLAWSMIEDIGVDSGQAGIYDLKYYRDDRVVSAESWYELNCTITSKPIDYAGSIPFGAVSTSGYGNGFYPVYISKNPESKVVGVRIVFIELEKIGLCINHRIIGDKKISLNFMSKCNC